MIKRHNGLNNTPALPIAIDGWMELREKDLVENALLLSWDQNALTYHAGYETVGVLVYSKLEYKKEFYIVLGYVDPQHRRKGIYKKLFSELREIAVKEGVEIISGGTYLRNTPMMEINKKLGRTEVAVITNFKVLAY